MVSVVLPTYNCAALLPATLKSLADQDYPRLELLAVDGGSTDATRNLLTQYGFRIIENPLRSNLYGLPLAFQAARGELVLHLDDDNVLDRPTWLREMVAPLVDDPHIVAAEPLFYVASSRENELTRYISLLGADDPLIVYLGFHERFSHLTNTWTGVPHTEEDRGGYLTAEFTDPTCVPSLACNATLIRRSVLLPAVRTPWLHIDGAMRIIRAGGTRWAKVRVGIVNHHTPSIWGFFVKKWRRMDTRAREAKFFEYRYPITAALLTRVVIRCVLVLPIIWDTLRGMYRRPDPAWLLHPILTLGTLVTYALQLLRLRIRGRTLLTPISVLSHPPSSPDV